MRSHRIRVRPSPVNGVLRRSGKCGRRETDIGRMACDEGGRDGSDASVSQGILETSRSPKRQGRVGSWRLRREHGLADGSVLNF